MPFETTDWTVSVFLFIALVLVRGFEKQIKTVSSRSYANIGGGLVVLAIVAVARLYHAVGLLDSVPFLSETVFFDLVYWIGIITGATFVISGVADWLPMARDYRRYHHSRIEHLDLLRKIEQLVGVESRIEMVLSTALQFMVEQMSLSGGAVFKCSYSRRLLSLEATTGDLPIGPETLKQIKLNPDTIWSSHQEIEPNPTGMLSNIPQELDPPLATLPIIVQRQPVGFFLLWNDQTEWVDSDDLLTLRLVTDVIARKIERDKLTLQHQAEDRYQSWRDCTEVAVNEATDTRQRFAVLVRDLSDQISFDQASLMVVDRKGMSAQRYSCGTTGRVLVEASLIWPTSGHLVKTAVETGQLVVYHDLDNEHQPEPSEIICDTTVRSLLVVPFSDGDRLTSVLILASRQKAAFNHRVQRQMRSLTSLVNSVIGPETEIGFRREENNRLKKLYRFWMVARTETQKETVLEQAALVISDETGADLVRVSVLDETGSFLESRALITASSQNEIVPANGQMILSLMPLHQQAMNAGRSVILDKSTIETAMSGIERRQALVDSVRSAMLVPLMHADRVIGIVSIGGLEDMSLDQTRQTFVKAVADQLAATMDSSSQSTRSFEIPLPDSIARRTKSQVRPSLIDTTGSARQFDELVESSSER
ncbi:MAG: GAF domain-containing protein [candidate division Zixibacteria bacterium]|nr:GAF domain-containing protein [candidate division Zixibacteria bacterium]